LSARDYVVICIRRKRCARKLTAARASADLGDMSDGVDGARARESSAASRARAATSIPFSHLTYAPRTSATTSATTNADDCLSCRVLGTSACAAGAAMVTWEIYREPRRVLSHKIAMGAFAAAFVALGAYRAVM